MLYNVKSTGYINPTDNELEAVCLPVNICLYICTYMCICICIYNYTCMQLQSAKKQASGVTGIAT